MALPARRSWGILVAAAAWVALAEDECLDPSISSVCPQGQGCFDPDSGTPDNWQCRCLGEKFGTAHMAVATCHDPVVPMEVNECDEPCPMVAVVTGMNSNGAGTELLFSFSGRDRATCMHECTHRSACLEWSWTPSNPGKDKVGGTCPTGETCCFLYSKAHNPNLLRLPHPENSWGLKEKVTPCGRADSTSSNVCEAGSELCTDSSRTSFGDFVCSCPNDSSRTKVGSAVSNCQSRPPFPTIPRPPTPAPANPPFPTIPRPPTPAPANPPFPTIPRPPTPAPPTPVPPTPVPPTPTPPTPVPPTPVPPTPVPPTPVPPTPTPPTPVPPTPVPPTPVPPTPVPPTPVPPTPTPPTPVPPTPVPPTPVPPTPVPPTPVPPTPVPPTPVPPTPVPPTPVPPTPVPPTPVPPTPVPPTPVPPTPVPPTPTPSTPVPPTPVPPTPVPSTPIPPPSIPSTPGPLTPAPPTPVPPTPTPSTPVPSTPSPPTTPAPPVIPQPRPAVVTPVPPVPPLPSIPRPPTPEPPTPVPAQSPTPAPPTPAPASTPAPSTPVPSTPAPSTPLPIISPTPAPSVVVPPTPTPATTPVPSTPVPSTPAPPTPVPETPVPDTSSTPAPVAGLGETPMPGTVSPATESPQTAVPDSPAPPTTSVPFTFPPTTAEPIPPMTEAPGVPVTDAPPATRVPHATPTPGTATASPATQAPTAGTTRAPTTFAPAATKAPALSPLTGELRIAKQPEDVPPDSALGVMEARSAGVKAGASAAAVAGVAGASAGPAMRLVATAAPCFPGHYDGAARYTMGLSPMQLEITGNRALGALIGDAAIAIAAILIGYIVFATASSTMRNELDAQGLMQFPSLPMLVFQFVYQGATLAAMDIVIYAELPAERVMGCAALTMLAVVPCIVFAKISKGVPRHALVREDDAPAGVCRLFLLGPGEWVSRKPTRDFASRWSSMLRPYSAKAPWFSILEFAASFAISGVQSARPETWTGCGHVKVACGAIFLILAVVEALTWPHLHDRNAMLDIMLLGGQAVAMFALASGYYAGGDVDAPGFSVSGTLLIYCAVVLVVRTLLDIICVAYNICTGRRKRLQDEQYELGVDGDGIGATYCGKALLPFQPIDSATSGETLTTPLHKPTFSREGGLGAATPQAVPMAYVPNGSLCSNPEYDVPLMPVSPDARSGGGGSPLNEAPSPRPPFKGRRRSPTIVGFGRPQGEAPKVSSASYTIGADGTVVPADAAAAVMSPTNAMRKVRSLKRSMNNSPDAMAAAAAGARGTPIGPPGSPRRMTRMRGASRSATPSTEIAALAQERELATPSTVNPPTPRNAGWATPAVGDTSLHLRRETPPLRVAISSPTAEDATPHLHVANTPVNASFGAPPTPAAESAAAPSPRARRESLAMLAPSRGSVLSRSFGNRPDRLPLGAGRPRGQRTPRGMQVRDHPVSSTIGSA